MCLLNFFLSCQDSIDIEVFDDWFAIFCGRDLEVLRAIRADVQVILMSGYERSRAAQLGDPPAGFLQKPFRSEDLLDAVAKLFAR